MQKTTIEFASHSWSPIIMKCPRGCEGCWHLRMCKRQAKNPRIRPEYRDIYAGKAPPVLDEERLQQPLKHGSATTTVVQLMGDLFAPIVPALWRRRIWRVMKEAQQHNFIVLTKYAKRMAQFTQILVDLPFDGDVIGILPNVIGMVSVSTQKDADERIPWLLQSPFAIRGVNVEPMLEVVDISDALNGYPEPHGGGHRGYVSHDMAIDAGMPEIEGDDLGWEQGEWQQTHPPLDWVSAGCESSKGRVGRPAKHDWFRSLRDQCKSSGTPYFLKQMAIDGRLVSMPMLDGKVWDQMPSGWRETALAGRKLG